MRSLPRVVAETPIDKSVSLVYWRDGKKQKSNVRVGELEKAEEEGLLASGPSETGVGVEVEAVGMKIAELNDALREEYNIDSGVKGVLISEVTPLSEAAQKGLFEGDVITEVNQQNVKSPDQVLDIIEKAQQNGRSSVLLLVSRDNDVRFVALRLSKGE